jgi:hypothetical protein
LHHTDKLQPRKIRPPADGTRGWSQIALDLLEGGWGRGLSAGQIKAALAQLTPPIIKTRSAVIGKVHRLGLPERRTLARKTRTVTTDERVDVSAGFERPREQRAKRTRTVDAGKLKAVRISGPGRVRRTAGDEVLAIPDIVEPSGTSILMCEATESQCKWPASGDIKEMRVCGDPVKAGPYCAFHAVRGYKQMPTKKRNARFFARQETDFVE